jgi:hypothetical protein
VAHDHEALGIALGIALDVDRVGWLGPPTAPPGPPTTVYPHQTPDPADRTGWDDPAIRNADEPTRSAGGIPGPAPPKSDPANGWP